MSLSDQKISASHQGRSLVFGQSAKPQVILLYPRTGLDLGSTVAPPHALLAVAAPVHAAGYDVRILDQRIQRISEETLSDLLSSDTLCVGISTMTGTQIKNALGLARMVRRLTNGRVPLVWGGTHPSIMPAQTLANENVDIVVIGEGDESFLELVRALENRASLRDVAGIMFMDGAEQVATPARPLLDVENLLPVPWELIDTEKYIRRDMYLRDRDRVLDLGQTSRGCPFQCGFCSSASIRQRRWRAMSPEKSLAMIEDGVRRFRLNGIWLRDDEFYIKRQRANEILQGMIDRKLDVAFYTAGTRADVFNKASDDEVELLKRAGAHTLKFGAESGSQRILDLMKKGLTVEQTLEANRKCMKHDIAPVFALMIGYPTETFEDIDKTIDLAKRLRGDNPRAQTEAMPQYTALPGTPDFDLAQQHGLVAPDSLEGWVNWLFEEHDAEGTRSPWLSATQRLWLSNITTMSVLSLALENIAGSTGNAFISAVGKPIARQIGHYYSWRLFNKRYRFAPELRIVDALRRTLFH